MALYSKFEDSSWVDTGLSSTSLTGNFTFVPTQSDGRYYFSTRALDVAGNRELLPADNGDSLTIYDTVPPSSNASSLLYNNTDTIMVSYSANDAVSGIQKVSLYFKKDSGNWIPANLENSALSGQFDFVPPDGEGIYYFTTRALDKSGLLESLPGLGDNGDSKTIFDTSPFDLTPPSTTLTYPSLSHYGNIDVYFTADDSENGIWQPIGHPAFSATGAFRLYPYEGRGRYYFYGRARDNAGNWAPLPSGNSNNFTDVLGLADCDLDNDSDFDELDSTLFAVGFKVNLTVPEYATGLSFYSKFYTAEFPVFICSEYNDQYAVIMNAVPDEFYDGNILTDIQGNVMSVNSAFLEVCTPQQAGGKDFSCPLGVDDLQGTGLFESNGATGWLEVKAPVVPGETIELFFVIWDSGDGVLDSTALVDKFSWITNYTGGIETVDGDMPPPTSFNLTSPAPESNPVFKNTSAIVFSWEESIVEHGLLTYTFELVADPSDSRWNGETFLYNAVGLTQNYFILNPEIGLLEDRSYLWEIKAFNESGDITFSQQNSNAGYPQPK